MKGVGGSRPDGIIMAKNLSNMEEYIEKEHSSGNENYFWRYTKPEVIFCDDTTYQDIPPKIVDGDGIYHADKIDKSKFFKWIR